MVEILTLLFWRKNSGNFHDLKQYTKQHVTSFCWDKNNSIDDELVLKFQCCMNILLGSLDVSAATPPNTQLVGAGFF